MLFLISNMCYIRLTPPYTTSYVGMSVFRDVARRGLCQTKYLIAALQSYTYQQSGAYDACEQAAEAQYLAGEAHVKQRRRGSPYASG